MSASTPGATYGGGFDIGPVSVSGSVTGTITDSNFTSCCEDGSEVTDLKRTVVIQISINVSIASASWSLPKGLVPGVELSIWAGGKLTLAFGGGASGSLSTNFCNGIDLQGRVCGEVFGSLSGSFGVQANLSVDWWWLSIDYSLGLYVTVSGTISRSSCYVCSPKTGCNWEKTKTCFSVNMTLNVDLLYFNNSFDLWSSPNYCW